MSLCLQSSALQTVGGVLIAIIILLVMVTVHEAGHYAAGKLLKFKINEFAIGFGPALFRKKRKNSEEMFSVRLLPLGGFCAFAGEDEETEDPSDPALFHNRKPWMRILVLLAGPLMNYLLALLLIFTLFFAYGQPAYSLYRVAQTQEFPSQYCLQEEDIILDINGKGVYNITDYITALNGKQKGDLVPFTVLRDGEKITLSVMLQSDVACKNLSDTQPILRAIASFQFDEEDPSGNGGLKGVSVRHGFFSTIGRGVVYSGKIGGMILQTLGELLTGKLALTSVGGPVTTIKVTSEAAAQGLPSILTISAYIGVNLAVFNLLPIPALDGSKVVLTAIEWIRKKPINRKVEAVINMVGFIAILLFAVLVDVLQFV